MTFGHIEALEVGFLQLQDLTLFDQVAISVGTGSHILHLVGVTRRLAFLVELEEIDAFVIPVIDPVAEVDAVIGITRSPHVDVDKVARAGNIGKEVGVCCQRLHDRLTFLILTVVNLHRIGIFVSSCVDSETEQCMVTHTPELLLLRTALHSR